MDGSDRLLRPAHAQKDARRIARDQVDQHEGDQADAQQHRDQLHRSVEDEAETVHGSLALS
jgi:hypothetical protein